MEWKVRKASRNVEDGRGKGSAMVAGGGIGGILIVMLVAFLGGDPGVMLDQLGGSAGTSSGQPYEATAEEEELAEFVSVVPADTEKVCLKLKIKGCGVDIFAAVIHYKE